MGDAGAILTHSPELAKKIEIIRNHGRGGHGAVGRNSRCDHFQAAVLHHKLEFIDEQNNKKKKQVAQSYFNQIKNPAIKVVKELIKTSSWHLFPMKVENNEVAKDLCAHLQSHGIGCSGYLLRKINGARAST